MGWVARLLGREADDQPDVELYCPYQDDDVPIASEWRTPVWSEEFTNSYGYRCYECGRIHTWVWGPPAPVYAGDKFRITITGS